MAGAGWRAWSTTETITLGRMQNNLQDQVVMTYANSTARAGVTAAAGMVSYLTDSDELEAYNGTSWVDVAGGLRYYFNGFGSTDYFGWIDGHTNSMTSPNAADGFAYIINGISGPYFVRDTTDTSRLYFTFGDGNDGWVYDADTEKITLWGSICLDGNNLFFGGESSNDYIQFDGNGFKTYDNGTVTSEVDGNGYIQGSGRRYYFGIGSNDYIQFDDTSKFFEFFSDGASIFRITDNGAGNNGDLSDVGTISASNGTAGAPTYGFAGDPDTGMFLQGGGDVRISVGASTKLRLTTAGAYMQEAYDATTASAANVFVTTAGQFQRSTSTWDVKENIELIRDHDEGANLLDNYQHLMPVAFDSLLDPGRRHFGFVHEWSPGRLHGLEEDKTIDTTAYLALTVAKVQECENRIAALEAAGRATEEEEMA